MKLPLDPPFSNYISAFFRYTTPKLLPPINIPSNSHTIPTVGRMPVIGRGRGKFATSKSKLFGQAAPSSVPAAAAQQPVNNGGGFGGASNTTTDVWGNSHSSNGNTDRFADSGEEVEVTFKVYNKCLPRIIGRGGSTIQQLQEESSAQINIEKREDDGTATPVVIKGSKLNVDHARKLVDDICEKFGGKYDNGGSGASGGFGSGGGFGGMAGGGDDGPQEDEDIWIPEDKCGRVIGRGGSKINEIQSDTGANVKVHDRDSAQDGKVMVTLTGTEGQRSQARKIIEELTSGGSGGGGGRWERTGDMEELDMWVETCRIGRVVGKGGCKIKEIQDTFNCRVDISKTETKDDDTRVTLTGLPDKTKEAKEYIDDLCERHLKQESFAASGAGGDDDWDVPAPSGNSNGGFGGGGGDSWPAANETTAAASAGDGWGPAPTGGDSGGGDAGGWGPGW